MSDLLDLVAEIDGDGFGEGGFAEAVAAQGEASRPMMGEQLGGYWKQRGRKGGGVLRRGGGVRGGVGRRAADAPSATVYSSDEDERLEADGALVSLVRGLDRAEATATRQEVVRQQTRAASAGRSTGAKAATKRAPLAANRQGPRPIVHQAWPWS